MIWTDWMTWPLRLLSERMDIQMSFSMFITDSIQLVVAASSARRDACLERLPPEIMLIISEELSVRDLVRLSQLCRPKVS
jgi:hypothetical protein